MQYVLDTWPVMEWLKDRKRVGDIFDDLIERAGRGEIVLTMSMMNLGEVLYSSAKDWGIVRAEIIFARVRELPITFVAISDDDVLAAARLKAVNKISYADAFAAALAIRTDCQLMTGDTDFRALEYAGVLRLEWLGI